MTSDSSTRRVWLAAAFGALLATAVGIFLHRVAFGRGFVNWSYDLLFFARGSVPAEEAVIVYLDDASYGALQQPRNAPWNRELHARLIERLSRAGARAIVFDIIFSDPNTNHPAFDERLARAMKASGRVILGIDVVQIDAFRKEAVLPFSLLLDSSAGAGSTEVLPDPDLIVRQHTVERYLDLPTLSWATAEFLQAPVTRQPGAQQVSRWLNYYGPANFLRSVSYHQALDPAKVADEFFRAKTVFVGARLLTKFAGERKDEYASPYSHLLTSKMAQERGTPFIAGVEIQATAFLNLLRGDWLRRWPPGTEQTLLIASGLLFGFGLVRLRPVMAAVLGLGGMALSATLFYLLFRDQLVWFPWLIVVLQIGVALAWSILFNSVQLYVQKRLYEQTLSVYLSPKLVKKFSGNPDLLKPGAEEQTLTIFFSDIVDFTSISQHMASDALAKLMNTYFQTAVAECIHKTDGTVVKYIGDAIFAFWNAPEAQTDHALRACEAALRLRERGLGTFDGHTLRTRIGIHTGLARVGNFGSLDRVDYTALGESVNLASRLEGLNKYLGTECVISQATKEAIGDRIVTRPVGQFQLKGFDNPVDVFELIDWPERLERAQLWMKTFAEALNNYYQQNLEFAAIGFRRTIELRPEDGPSKFYLQRIDDLALQPSSEGWTRYTLLKEK